MIQSSGSEAGAEEDWRVLRFNPSRVRPFLWMLRAYQRRPELSLFRLSDWLVFVSLANPAFDVQLAAKLFSESGGGRVRREYADVLP